MVVSFRTDEPVRDWTVTGSVYAENICQGEVLESKIEAARRLYAICRDMDIEETMELVLNAESEEEGEFFSLLSDFIL